MSIQSVLDAVGTALGVIKSLADAPGVNLLPYVKTVSSVIDVAQIAIGQGKSIANLIADLKVTFDGGIPTPEQLAALDARIAAARAKLHAPLPEPEEGEPA
jgi:D-serine deaminase-like pyridoxal phosphate-dependent protein